MKLTNTEAYLWNYIQNHLIKIPTTSIVELSAMANVSTATIVRTLKKKGYDGYTSFRHSLKNLQISNDVFKDINKADSEINKAILKNKEEVLFTLNNMDSMIIEDAVQKIYSAERVIFFARGLSEYIAEELSLRLRVLNKYCETYTDPNIIFKKSLNIPNTDIVIFISLQGETTELITALNNCIKNETSTLSITAAETSSIAIGTDLSLVGFKSLKTNFPEFEVKSRLPLSIISRILSDAYATRISYD